MARKSIKLTLRRFKKTIYRLSDYHWHWKNGWGTL